MHPDIFSLPTLRGRETTLRPPAAGELDRLARELAHDPQTSPWWGTDEHVIEGWFDDPDFHILVVECEADVSGVICFEEETDPNYRVAGIDIGLFSHSVERGLGPDALLTLASWLINVRGHHRLTIDPAVANERAIHVYKKVGFAPIGVARRYERGSDGTWHDNLLMDLLAEELST